MNASTDNSLSIGASEFIWTDENPTIAHGYISAPTLDALRRSGARTVLDLGCGNGAFTSVLKRDGYSVEGCDVSASALEHARKACAGTGFFQHDISDPLPSRYAASFDAVVSIEVIEHLLLPRHLLRSPSGRHFGNNNAVPQLPEEPRVSCDWQLR